MRLESISIENLASLLGRQQTIDLRSGQPPIGGAGLIAITGPTGAGKSTILDAVSLALFGETPRQGQRQGDPTALLSRSAVEGRVLVRLRLADGTPWLVEWSVRRAHGRLEGELQPPQRRIVHADSGDRLADGAKEVQALVERRLLLTAPQFRTVVMLAQGDFAAFLKAPDADRAQLLELLTGDDRYSRIGRAAYERWSALQQACAAGDAALAQVMTLAAEDRARLETELAEAAPLIAAAQRGLELAQLRQQAWTAWQQAERSAAGRARDAEAAEAAHAAAATGRERLRQAERAQAVAVPLAAASAGREQLRQAALAVGRTAEAVERAAEAALAAAGLAGGAVAAALAAAEARLQQAGRQAALAAIAADDWQPVQTLADAASQAATALAQARQQAGIAQQRIPGTTRLLADAQAALVREQAAVASAAAVLATAQTAQAASRAGVDAETLERRRQQLASAAALLAQPCADPAAAAAAAAASEAAAGIAAAEAAQAAEAQRLAREAMTAQEQQVARLGDLARVSAFGHLLEPGLPCPLCGSTAHPQPAHADADLLSNARLALEDLRRAVAASEHRLAEAQQAAAQAGADLQARRERQAEAMRARAARQAAWQPLAEALGLPHDEADPAALADEAEAIASRLRRVREGDAAAQEAAQLLAAAKDRAQPQLVAVERAQARLQADEQQAVAADLAAATAGAAAQAAAAIAGQALDALLGRSGDPAPADRAAWLRALPQRSEQARQAATAARQAERDAALQADAWRALVPAGTALPPAAGVPAEPAAALAAARAALATARDRAGQAQQAVATAQAAAGRSEAAARDLVATEAALGAALRLAGWADEAAAGAALMPDAGFVALRQDLARLDLELASARTALQLGREQAAAAAAAATALGLAAEPDPTDGLALAVQTAQAGLAGLQDRGGALRQQLLQDDERRGRRERLLAGQEELQAQRARAERLKLLIGCATGSRFNRCAQALTLDQLLSAANHHLADLAPRYRLRREPSAGDGQASLGILVIDGDQAEVERSISTLSGGETFLVSLALALALADLQRGRLRVGTLCIDEGFGSLDEQTLGVAMSVLERLQQRQDTQILLISHVGALHERVAHRIEVVRRGGGVSRLRLVGPAGIVDSVPALPPPPPGRAADGRAADDLLRALAELGPASSGQLQERLGVDAGRIAQLVAQLGPARVVRVGKGRGTRYTLPDAAG